MAFSFKKLLLGAAFVTAAFFTGGTSIVFSGLGLSASISLGGLLASVGIGLALDAYSPDIKIRKQKGNPLSTTEHIPIVYGEQRVGLRLVDRRIDGSSSKKADLYLTGVACLGSRDGAPNGGAIEGYYGSGFTGHVYLDDHEAIQLNPLGTQHVERRFIASGEAPIPAEVGEGAGNAIQYLALYEGTDAQTVDPTLNSKFSGDWPATSKGLGLAYLVLGLRFKESIFLVGQPPNVQVDVRGRVLWDPRLGPSSNTANWAWSDNPILCIIDWALTPKQLGGGGLSESQLAIEALKTEADYCDDMVSFDVTDPVTGAVTAVNKTRFTCNYVADTSSAEQILADLLSSCTGEPVWEMGKFRVHISKDVGSSGFDTLGEDEILGEASWEIASPGIKDRYNTVKVKYIDPDQNYEVIEAEWPERGSNAFLAADNNVPAILNLNLPATTDFRTAKQIAQIRLKTSRQGITAHGEFKQIGLQYRIGDVVILNQSTPNWSGGTKPMEVKGFSISGEKVSMALREYQPSTYATEDMEDIPDFPDTVSLDEQDLPAPSNLALTSGDTTIRELGDGTVVPRIKATWDEVDHALVHHYDVQAKRSSESEWEDFPAIDDEADLVSWIEPVEVGQTWDVRVRSVTARNFASAWTEETGHTVAGKTTAPTTPTGLTAAFNYQKEGISVSWDASPDADFSHYVLKRDGADWDAATVLDDDLRAATYFLPLGEIPGRNITFRLKAFDRSGNESGEATYAFVDTQPDMSLATITERLGAHRVIGIYIPNGATVGGDHYEVYASDTQADIDNLNLSAPDQNLFRDESQTAFKVSLIWQIPDTWDLGQPVYYRIRAKDALTEVLGEQWSWGSTENVTPQEVDPNDITGGPFEGEIEAGPTIPPSGDFDGQKFIHTTPDPDVLYRWDATAGAWKRVGVIDEDLNLGSGDPDDPVPANIAPSFVGNEDGTVTCEIAFTYTQGTFKADYLMIYAAEGGGSTFVPDDIVIGGYSGLIGGTMRARFRLKPGLTYSFGIQAVRKSSSGVDVSNIVSPTASPDWRDVAVPESKTFLKPNPGDPDDFDTIPERSSSPTYRKTKDGYVNFNGQVVQLRNTAGSHDVSGESAFKGDQLTRSGVYLTTQIGDQRHIPQNNVANIQATQFNVSGGGAVLTVGTSRDVTMKAHSVQYGGFTVAYNQVGITVGSDGLWYIYLNDVNYAGGSQTLLASKDSNAIVSGAGYYYVGKIQVTNGSSGTGGGGGGCLAEGMFVGRDRPIEDVRLGDLVAGWLPRFNETPVHQVQARFPARDQPCVEIVEPGGGRVVISESTLVPLSDGREVAALLVDGERMPVLDEDGSVSHETVTVEPVGWRSVVPVSVGGGCFFGGADPARMIATHNVENDPKLE